jgi:hypothetical protein
MASIWAIYAVGLIFAMLPRRWRAAKDQGSDETLAHIAVFSGIVEAILALVFVRLWYVKYFRVFGDKFFFRGSRMRSSQEWREGLLSSHLRITKAHL